MIELDKGTPVRVYKNLNLGNWTVQIKVTGKGWRKFGGVDECHIFNAAPVTSEKGQARIIAKGQREVIASIQGEWGGDFAFRKWRQFHGVQDGNLCQTGPHF